MNKTYNIIELVGSSDKDFTTAIHNGVSTAKKRHKNLRWFEVVEQRGHIDDDGVAHFQTHIKIGFCD